MGCKLFRMLSHNWTHAGSAPGEFLAELHTGARQSLQGGECIAAHGALVQAPGRLIKRPQSLCQIRVEFRKLSQQTLRDLTGSQIRAAQGAEQRQQIESGGFQPCTQSSGGCLLAGDRTCAELATPGRLLIWLK